MTLHIDVFFCTLNDSTQKEVYMTAATQCDQGMSGMLGMADLVLGKFKKEHPYVIKTYGKSDNTGSYHGNFGAETLYKIYISKGVNFVQYDYNEPCRGKDQCDQESAVVKNLIRSFVDNVISANHVFKALQFAKTMKNTKVGVVEIDSSKSIIKGKTIPDISQFHSVEFFDDGMRFWQYFDVG